MRISHGSNATNTGKLPLLAQVCKLIAQGLVPKLARRHGIDKQARSFSAWSHLVSLLHAQLTHAIGRNDVCDSLRQHARWFGSCSRGHPFGSQHPFSCQQNAWERFYAVTLLECFSSP
ncbi:MAG: DUF4372 domain-containing protein [Chthoniobacterales bacterium]